MAVPAPWDCPICLRRVPAKVAECYCGYKRAGPAGSGAGSGAGAKRLGIALSGLLLAGGAAFYFLQPVPGRPVARVTSASPKPVPATPAATSAPTTLPAAWRALAIETTPSPGAPIPATTLAGGASPSPTPTPGDSIDAQREKGLSAFEATLTSLSARASDFREKLRRYDDQCASASTRVVGCDSARSELTALASEIAAGVESAEEQARRSWLDPGQQRESRERHGLDDKAIRELLKAADDAVKR